MQSFSVDDIVEYPDIFSESDHSSILRYTQLDKWAWGHKSNQTDKEQYATILVYGII